MIDILVLSRNREKQLISSLARLSLVPVRVIVAHNGEEEISSSLIPGNTTYLYLPGFTFGQRAKIIKEHLQSPYSLIMADDDGLVFSELEKLRNFLDMNPSYASVGGACVGAFLYGNQITGAISYSEMRGYKNNFSNPLERIEYQMKKGAGVRPTRAGLYKLFRREAMGKLLEVLANCESISTPYVYEVCGEIVSAWAGPSLYIDSLYWIRNWQTQIISDQQWDRRRTFPSWWEDFNFENEREIFSKNLATSLQIEYETVIRLISEYVVSWGNHFRVPTQKELNRKNWRGLSILQEAKSFLLPHRSPTELEQVIATAFPAMTNWTRNEICDVARSMLNIIES